MSASPEQKPVGKTFKWRVWMQAPGSSFRSTMNVYYYSPDGQPKKLTYSPLNVSVWDSEGHLLIPPESQPKSRQRQNNSEKKNELDDPLPQLEKGATKVTITKKSALASQ